LPAPSSVGIYQARNDVINELDAGGRQGLLNDYEGRRPRVHLPGLKVTDRYNTDVGRVSELLLAPIKQAPSRPTLRR
jgi:hypothetical protein